VLVRVGGKVRKGYVVSGCGEEKNRGEEGRWATDKKASFHLGVILVGDYWVGRVIVLIGGREG